MNYKETIYFIAKCLTVSSEKSNRAEVEMIIKSPNVDWDNVVKVSTSHFVLTAIYCNFKRVGFLKHLPSDLVSYMKYISDINRERNKKIIEQVNDLNTFLKSNNISPIFLKGAGNLFAGIYQDISERMIGDIDFIFSKEDYPKAITILREYGYYEVKKKEYYYPDNSKHYRRLKKKKNLAAIEIHSKLINIKKFDKEFNYDFIEKDTQSFNGINVLSYANKLNLSIISNQINDDGYYYKTIALRNAYDVFLLSKKTNTKVAVNSLSKLNHYLNCFLAACYTVFNKVETIDYNKNLKTDLYLRNFNNQFEKPIREKSKFYNIYIFIKSSLHILFKSIIYKEYRVFLFKSFTDKKWYKEKAVQFGINSKRIK